MDRKYDVITLGEILLRLSTPINGRLAQGDTLMKHLGGAELNIASEIGQLGLKTAMISKIPNNLLAAFIKNQMNASRVSENYLISDTADDSRIGVYYYEYGSYPRKPRVVYDRKHSSINNIDIKDVPETMFYNTRLFHTSGITLGLGGNAQKFAIECIRKFKEQGTLISFDVNYRANLWTGEEARACIEQILCRYLLLLRRYRTPDFRQNRHDRGNPEVFLRGISYLCGCLHRAHGHHSKETQFYFHYLFCKK